MKKKRNTKGILQLEDGTEIEGVPIGKPRFVSGEVVFTTGMVGYAEAVTDPSYRGQILIFTYPLIGNYGVREGNFESDRIQVSGVIVSESINHPSHATANRNFHQWLYQHNIPGLVDVDTRRLTLRLRSRGVMKGNLCFNEQDGKKPFADISQKNLAAAVSCKTVERYGSFKLRVALIDCGVKLSIVRELAKFKVNITRVPWNWGNFDDFAGVVISNGPGDPKTVKETINNVSSLLALNKPVLGVCLGNQILTLAAGGDTYKLPYGHRSHNQPVFEKATGRAYLTIQNHGYAVNMDSLGNDWEEWFVNLNDGTNEGIRHTSKPFWAIQFHPEGSPGPEDTSWIFAQFIELCRKYSS